MQNKIKKNNWGQSILEYGVILGIVSLAFLMMQVYMKRGIQATVKRTTDYVLGPQEHNTRSTKEARSVYESTSESEQRIVQRKTGRGYRKEFNITTTNNAITISEDMDFGTEPPGEP
jgi:Flp pilus assembly pilin Flp